MTYFIRVLGDVDKKQAITNAVDVIRSGNKYTDIFEVDAKEFDSIPGSPFAYWISNELRGIHNRLPAYERAEGRTAKVGLQTSDDDRFVRSWWEVTHGATLGRWIPFAKGESIGSYYGDISLVVGYSDADQLGLMKIGRYGRGADCYYKPGITWALRARKFAPRILPAGCIFSNRGQSCFANADELCALLGILSSQAVDFIYKMSLGRFGYPEFLVGPFLRLPIPDRPWPNEAKIEKAAYRSWSFKRTLDTVEETSHAFQLPAALRARLGDYDPPAIEVELARIQAEIDEIAFDLYGFSEADRAAAQAGTAGGAEAEDGEAEDEGDEDTAAPIDLTTGLLSWAVGVAFGRFDWRLATGEREAPPEPDPFDPLPAKSPGMLPDGAEPFHAHAGILVDDPGHPRDLARLVEEVLVRVDAPVPPDVRRWLQRDFFAFHLQRYSKSRRKAPIYWPLATTSGAYTLWLYYPSLTSQTLYTAVNDFVEPKLKQVGQEVTALRGKSGRSRDEDKTLEALQSLELELIDLRDTLLQIAATWHPNHDDGVQITAAPLWPLFRHKPWQKVLKDTWAKLEKGDYDWSHLAMTYWPDRVRDKCKTDKSLAIAHGLEDLYVEPATAPKKARGKKKTGGEE